MGRSLLMALAVLALLSVAGCGGGGGGEQPADEQVDQVTVSCYWAPLAQTSVPARAASVGVVVKEGSQNLAAKLVDRPLGAISSSDVAFNGLPADHRVNVVVTMYAGAQGAGDVQGSRTFSCTVPKVGRARYFEVGIGMPPTALLPSTAPAVVQVGDTLDLTQTASNVNYSVVVVPGALRWSTDTPALVTVDQNGIVTALRPSGALPAVASVKARDAATGRIASASIRITSSAQVALAPSHVHLQPGASVRFSATVTDAPETGVDWSVQQGAAGGSIAADGTYTAPATPGIYTVVAASHYDTARTAEAYVSVP